MGDLIFSWAKYAETRDRVDREVFRLACAAILWRYNPPEAEHIQKNLAKTVDEFLEKIYEN